MRVSDPALASQSLCSRLARRMKMLSLHLKQARVISISGLSATLWIRILPPLIKTREKDETRRFDCTPHVVLPQRSAVPTAPRTFSAASF